MSEINHILWKNKNEIEDEKIILFISEELASSFPKNSEDYLGFDEFEVLNDIIECQPANSTLIIKTHPEEKMINTKDMNQIR